MGTQHKESTDKLLADCLKQLVCKKPFEKVTVKEITDLAGVIRPTFYNHFQDKYEVIEWIIYEEVLNPARPLIQSGMYEEAILFIFTLLEKEKKFYSRLAKMEGQNSLSSITVKCIAQVLLDIIGDVKPKNSWLTAQNVALFYAHTMTMVVITWLQDDLDITAREISEIYQYMMNSSMSNVIEELQSGEGKEQKGM